MSRSRPARRVGDTGGAAGARARRAAGVPALPGHRRLGHAGLRDRPPGGRGGQAGARARPAAAARGDLRLRAGRHPLPGRRGAGLRGPGARRRGLPDRGRRLGYRRPPTRSTKRSTSRATGSSSTSAASSAYAGWSTPAPSTWWSRGAVRSSTATSRCRIRRGCRATPTAAPRSWPSNWCWRRTAPTSPPARCGRWACTGPATATIWATSSPWRARATRSGSADGSARFSHAYSENVAHAHLLAAEHLFPGSKVAGQAYFIGDHYPARNFFDFMEPYLEALDLPVPRGASPTRSRTAWPAWSSVVAPRSNFNRFSVIQTCVDHTYRHDRAERDFGYRPPISEEEAFRRTLADIRPAAGGSTGGE